MFRKKIIIYDKNMYCKMHYSRVFVCQAVPNHFYKLK